MTVRTTLFWIHLAAGITCGSVVLIMSVTGAAIALQPQILEWAEQNVRGVRPPSPEASWLGPDVLVASVRQARPELIVTGLTLEHDRTQAAAVTVTAADAPASGGRAAVQSTVWVNPYTGAILGQLDPTSPWRRFFRVATDWHRWLAMSGEHRAIGRWITGISNAGFLLLALTGMYLWIPRWWSRRSVTAVALFRRGLSGKARDFNWHNVIGIWCAPVLVVLTFTAMAISFPKMYGVIYTVTGIEPSPTVTGQQNQRAAEAATDDGGLAIPGLDELWPLAESHLPSWRSIAMRLPQQRGQPVTFTMNDRARLNRMARSTLTVDPSAGHVVRWEPYGRLPAAQRLRTWLRFGHTGELWGAPGQIVCGAASALSAVLVWTGIALAGRRFVAWRTRRRRDEPISERRAA